MGHIAMGLTANSRPLTILLARRAINAGLAFILLSVAALPARGDRYCEDCMERALDNHWADTLASIQKAWGQYQAVVDVARKIEAGGTNPQKAKAREILAKAQAAWKPYESMAREYASPQYSAQVEEYQSYLTGHLEETRQQLRKETELYAALSKSTLEEQRRRVLNDMIGPDGRGGFIKEAEDLKKMFYVDLGLGVFSAAKVEWDLYQADRLAAITPVKGWGKLVANFSSATKNKAALTRQATVMARLKAQGAIADGIISNGPKVLETLRDDDSSQQVGAAVQLVADTALKATRAVLQEKPALLARTSPALNATAARAGYLQLVAPALDNLLIAHAFSRLKEADQRIEDVNKLEQTWQRRIKAAGNELHETERRLKLVETEMAYQKKIAAVYAGIETVGRN